jgi:acetyl esterase/lipase
MKLCLLLAVLLSACAPRTSWIQTTDSYDSTNSSSTLTFYRPKGSVGPVPTVVFVHGGAFRVGGPSDAEKYADVLARDGIQVVSVGYRLTSSGARWPQPLDDVRAAVRYVRANAEALGVGKFGVMGASAGGCLAAIIHLEEDPVDGGRPPFCVEISGEGDLRGLDPSFVMSDAESILEALFGHPAPFTPEELLALSPASLARPDCSVFMVHSIYDEDVYVDQGDRLYRALETAGANPTYLRRYGAAHGDEAWEQDGQARAQVTSFLLDRLR